MNFLLFFFEFFTKGPHFISDISITKQRGGLLVATTPSEA